MTATVGCDKPQLPFATKVAIDFGLATKVRKIGATAEANVLAVVDRFARLRVDKT
jgi:hypothetical protein